jgi:replicative DNA helicase
VNLHRAAERAVVGALLLEPARFDDVGEWLEARDFEGVAEFQAFEAMAGLRSRSAALTPEAVESEVRDTVTPGTQMADAAHLVSLMHETPEPSRATTYGRMVLELSIRRRVATDAAGLRQRAEAASSTNDLNLVFAHVDGIRRGVETLHRRETRATGSHSVTPAFHDGGLRQLVRFPRSEHYTVERDAILALVDQPGVLDRVGRWLRAGDFGDEEASSLFSELVALHDANNPIDRITVAWRAAKVGVDGPICDSLVQRPTQPTTGQPELMARRVLEQSVQSAVIATSEELERMAEDPSVNPTSLAYARLNALWPQQRRLIKARFALAE